jgi:predicted CXXCH cytochrome family protein
MRKLRSAVGVVSLLLAAPAIPLPGPSGQAWAQVPRHNCTFCHELHGAGFSQLKQYDVIEELCWSCHSDSGPEFVDRDGTDVAPPKGPFEAHDGAKHTAPTGCWDCHNHEGSAAGNRSMIQASMPVPHQTDPLAVVFTDTIGVDSYADTLSATNVLCGADPNPCNNVCQVCHSSTNHHRFNNPKQGGVHNAQVKCTAACHPHAGVDDTEGEEDAFSPRGGCTACHLTTQDNGDGVPVGGRRVIVPEFERSSHHIDWTQFAAGSQTADSIPDSDCETCHEQSQHQQGNVRLWNVDDPGNTAAAIVLNGDPATSSTEAAKLTTFCLVCHDSNGANGDASPFSDGVTRPFVNPTTWTSASHNATGSLSCFGDGTFGCHASGHGSEKRRLLSPPDVAPTAPANAEEEEGFCFNCHSSTGVASSDIQTAFNQPINWVTQAAGINDNLNLNDRHDVQYAAQNRSGAQIECTDCHNPHVATSALPYILNPDPGDAHVVGTDYYFYASTSDTLSEFCLDCHDGSFPTSVTDQTTSIVNIQGTWGSDQMGGDVGAGNLEPGTGWVVDTIIPCWTCHSPHPVVDEGSTNLYAMVDTIRDTSGTALAGYYQRVQGQWRDTLAYGFSANASGAAPVTDGGSWCMTCHNRTAMVSQDNCGSCHRHGDPNQRF